MLHGNIRKIFNSTPYYKSPHELGHYDIIPDEDDIGRTWNFPYENTKRQDMLEPKKGDYGIRSFL